MKSAILPQVRVELFRIEGATHIETYWVPRYVDAAMAKLTAFYAKTL